MLSNVGRACSRALCRLAPSSSKSITECVHIDQQRRQYHKPLSRDRSFAVQTPQARLVSNAASQSHLLSQQINSTSEKEDELTNQSQRRGKLRSIDIRKLVERDKSVEWYPQDVYSMYMDTVQGRVDEGWKTFHGVVRQGEEGKPSASIWHWYVMVGLIARDPSVPLEEVRKMVMPLLEDYESGPFFNFLRNREEMDGSTGQQIALYFSLMHNLRLRMTVESLNAVLYYFEKMMEHGLHPSSRHINVLCVTLIHLDRSTEAMQAVRDWFEPVDESANEQDCFGWGAAKRMDEYTVAMIMYASLQEGKARQAYEMFKLSISDAYRLPISKITLKLLLWAASQPYEAIRVTNPEEKGSLSHESSMELRKEEKEWEKDTIWDGIPSCIRARDIFRALLFACYPELESVENPLYQVRSGQEGNVVWKFYARFSRWGDHIARVTEPLLRWQSAASQAEEIISKAAIERHQNPDGSQSDMKPDENSFDKYVELLSYVGIYEEVPWSEFILVLAWMKHLDVRPTQTILIRACWAMNHLVPLVAESFHADSPAGPLHDYLVEWLGEGCIPHPAQITAYIQSRQQLDW